MVMDVIFYYQQSRLVSLHLSSDKMLSCRSLYSHIKKTFDKQKK